MTGTDRRTSLIDIVHKPVVINRVCTVRRADVTLMVLGLGTQTRDATTLSNPNSISIFIAAVNNICKFADNCEQAVTVLLKIEEKGEKNVWKRARFEANSKEWEA